MNISAKNENSNNDSKDVQNCPTSQFQSVQICPTSVIYMIYAIYICPYMCVCVYVCTNYNFLIKILYCQAI